MTGQRLINSVIDDLINHMVQARAVVGVADIHPGALAHGLQALENLNGIGPVFFRILLVVSHVPAASFCCRVL